MPYTHNKELTEKARKLRKNMTNTERKLWLTYLKDYPLKFYRQRVFDYNIADFYCSKAKLVIEIDGYFHYGEERFEYERNRETYFKKNKIKILRFTNANVDEDFADVCRIIDEEAKRGYSLFNPSGNLLANLCSSLTGEPRYT